MAEAVRGKMLGSKAQPMEGQQGMKMHDGCPLLHGPQAWVREAFCTMELSLSN